MNDDTNPTLKRTIDDDQTAIDFTLRWGQETLHSMRLDAETPDDRCEHYDDCDEPVRYQISICDAPELEPNELGSDTYLLCDRHAGQSLLNFLNRTL
jgi:hypothetical protein